MMDSMPDMLENSLSEYQLNKVQCFMNGDGIIILIVNYLMVILSLFKKFAILLVVE